MTLFWFSVDIKWDHIKHSCMLGLWLRDKSSISLFAQRGLRLSTMTCLLWLLSCKRGSSNIRKCITRERVWTVCHSRNSCGEITNLPKGKIKKTLQKITLLFFFFFAFTVLVTQNKSSDDGADLNKLEINKWLGFTKFVLGLLFYICAHSRLDSLLQRLYGVETGHSLIYKGGTHITQHGGCIRRSPALW